ncbi:MAG: HEAT repeat domain-containing protein [Deltaproteobacteria bacterium]|nr:HEAT repeat domain-containing protein [Deltaproteobacteria bacterium]
MALKDLLDEVKKRSGVSFEFRDPKAALKIVTVEFKSRPLEEALKTLLRGLSFFFSYEGNRLVRVLVFGSEQAVSQPSRPRPASPLYHPESLPDFDELLEKSREEGLKAIANSLRGNNSEAKILAIDALQSLDDPRGVTLLSEALSDSDSTVKTSALSALREKEGSQPITALRKGLQDPDPSFRIEILEALAEKGQLDSVRSALSDRNQQVREKAAELLQTYKETE